MDCVDFQEEPIYARAISVDEYDMRVFEGSIYETEWVLATGETATNSYGSFEAIEASTPPPAGTQSLWFLKSRWVDPKYRRSGGDAFAIIIAVRGRVNEFARGIASPRRYLNTNSISLDRVNLIYDPEGTIHGSKIDLDLTHPLANARPFRRG